MAKKRASIFEPLGELDVGGFAPKPGADEDAPTKAQVKAVAESANFKSREPSTPEPSTPTKPVQRRILRTGRNVQLNVKTSQEAINDFYAITDANAGWVLGYTFERAVAALKLELSSAVHFSSTGDNPNSTSTGPRVL